MKNEKDEPLKVGIMDCDLYGPSVPLLLGAADRPELVGDNILAPVESYDIKFISMGLLIDEESPVVWRGPMIMKTIQQFADNVRWGELDYLLIDLPLVPVMLSYPWPRCFLWMGQSLLPLPKRRQWMWLAGEQECLKR